jgi:hypothetical protein
MAIKAIIFTVPLVFISATVFADSTLDAAIGGGIGGAAGAAIGNELGGRNGAVLGAAIGGATGAAITTDDDRHEHYYDRPRVNNTYNPPASNNDQGSFCPPGQRKKGRC